MLAFFFENVLADVLACRPNYGILRGMEIGARQEGVMQNLGMLPSPGAVGVAF